MQEVICATCFLLRAQNEKFPFVLRDFYQKQAKKQKNPDGDLARRSPSGVLKKIISLRCVRQPACGCV